MNAISTSVAEVISGYQFLDLSRPGLWRARCERFAHKQGLLGTVLVAAEGINFSLAGSSEALNCWLAWLAAELGLDQPVINRQPAAESPFRRLRVRLRDELVTFDPEVRPDAGDGSVHLDPEAWNECIADPEVQLVDTRNDYEFQLGHFDGALNPGTESFTEFKRYCEQELDPARPVAMYCTGGVRCEKAGPWLSNSGFKTVYQLHGGILGYLARTEAKASRWQGECFVFDDRVSVNSDLFPSGRRLCRGCRRPAEGLDAAGNPVVNDENRCETCGWQMSVNRAASLRERARQLRLRIERGSESAEAGSETGSAPA